MPANPVYDRSRPDRPRSRELHNRAQRVPRAEGPQVGHLELIIDQLGGDIETFRALWRAARQAELAAPGAVTIAPPPRTNRDATAATPVSFSTGGQRFDFVMASSKLPPHERGVPGKGVRTGVERTLHDVVRDRKGVWIGWAREKDDPSGLVPSPDGPHFLWLPLSSRDIELYLEGYCDFYRATDVMVVTSLSDGMNLVAKEYVAGRVDNRGTLVLSEFTGAAAELDEAILVNPNDTDELKHAILQAITMSPTEQNRRIKAMRDRLRTHDSRAWVIEFMTSLVTSTVN
jgi:trehalose-6-phosphate synthase